MACWEAVVSRVPVVVRDAREADASAIARLWSGLIGAPGTDTVGETPELVVSRAVGRSLADPASRIVVAEDDGRVVGCAFLRISLVSPVHEERVVHVSHVQVDPTYARVGVGRSLVEASLGWAEERQIESLVVATATDDREASRFLARLGLSQVAALRGATVTALRARLPQDPSGGARGGLGPGRRVAQVVAARRSQLRPQGRTQERTQGHQPVG
jgi:N-acetylglutamate synthase-like GNAT family acetyltransferase